MVREGREAFDDSVIARDWPRPEQRLALPGGPPAPVVLLEGVEAPGERPLFALRAERGVDADDPLGRRRAVAEPEQRAPPPVSAASMSEALVPS